jgi:hypothetical protein
MLRVPRPPYEDGKYDNKSSNDHGERSAADGAFPILTIRHMALPSDIGKTPLCARWFRIFHPQPVSGTFRKIGGHFASRDVPVSWLCAYRNHAAGQTGSADTLPSEPSPFAHLKSNKEKIQ